MEKIYNFAKKDFFIFASTYVATISLVLLCFFPVCLAFERSEQNQALAEIRDYATSMLGELDLQEQAIFNATRNLYSDRNFTSVYYNSTRSSSSSLFYDMTLLQKRIKLYYQNLEYVQDVLVYLPKFNYVLTQNYIFDSRDSFYSYIKSSAFEGTPDWLETFPLNNTGISFYSDQLTDCVNSEEIRNSLNFSYYFPTYGDPNVRMLVIVQLDPDAVAKSFLLKSASEYGFTVLKNGDGEILVQHNYPDNLAEKAWEIINLPQSEQGYLTIGVKNEYFKPIHQATIRLIFADLGIAFLLGTIASIYFAYKRSRPIERILHIIHDMDRQPNVQNSFLEIEGTVLNMISEISHCKTTIESLDTMVADSLKEKLFISGLSTEQEIHSFQQYFGDFSFSMNALVFSIPEKTAFSEEISLKELLYEQLSQLSQNTIILYQAENYIYCLMESVSGLSDLLSTCLKHIRELHNQSVKVGVSNPFQDISYTQHASTQAKRRLSAGYRIDGVYVFTHTYSSRAVRSLISIQDLDNLQRTLLSGNGQNADRILEKIHQTISHSEQNSVELRQMFFSLRSVYATVCNQFSLEAERNGETRYHAPILPNDLDEYDLDSVYEVFRNLNIELQQQYGIVMARTARNLGADILAYIDQNYTDPNLCAGVIADVFHISEKYVFQLLKSCCNETLNDRILRLRIDEGIRLLTTTDLTITTIAKKTGFSSSNTMYKAFMRVKGISPSSYRGKEI